MTVEKNKWIDAVAKLVKLTQEGRIRWHSQAPSKNLFKHPEDKIESVFTAAYEGKSVRLYKKTYFVIRKRFLRADPDQSGTEKRRLEKIFLELYDTLRDETLWTFPDLDTLEDLYGAVQFQVAGVKDFLDSLLDED